MQLVSAQEQSDAVLTVHVVQRGENLFRIALQYDLFADEVAKANGISNSESISVGQRLIIPLISDTPLSFLTHTVAAGETLESIARYYGKSIDELMNLNSLTALGEIFLGQELIVVAGDEGAIPAATPEPDSAILSNPADAASVSNRTSLIIGDPDFAFVHVVEAGDTVFDIGLRYNQTVSTVAQANNLLDATKIFIGQKLIIPGIEPPRLAQDLPENVSSFTIDPLILVEGRTGRIEIRTTEVVTLSGSFLDQELRIIERENGTRHSVFVGIPMFTEQAVYPLQLRLTGNDGASVPVDANLQVVAGGYGHQNIKIDNNELLAPAVEDQEIGLLVGLTNQFSAEKRWNESLSLPAAATMNAVFGILRSYNGSPYDRFHRGVDFAGASGTSVLAAGDGMVVLADMLHIRGNTIVIDHGWGLYTAYAHQSTLLVQPGEIVTSGQTIGTIGSTGRSTGPHLHWEVWLNGVNVDPMQWVQEQFN